MSSYVINKEEFIKVAGFISALNNRHNFVGVESGLHLGEIETNEAGYLVWHEYSQEEIIKKFKTLYQANRLSVERQYGDEITSENYLEADEKLTSCEKLDFDIYYGMAKSGLIYRNILKDGLMCLMDFRACLNYQTEDEELNKYCMDFMDKIVIGLYRIAYHKETEDRREKLRMWGEFNLLALQEENINTNTKVSTC